MMIPIDRLPRRRADARFPKVEHREIHRLLDAGVAPGRIARQFGRTLEAIRYHQIQCAAVHARFTVGPSDPIYHEEAKRMPDQKLNPEQREALREAIREGATNHELIERFGVSASTLTWYRKNAAKVSDSAPRNRHKAPAEPAKPATWTRLPGGGLGMTQEEVAEFTIAHEEAEPASVRPNPAVIALNAKRIELAAKRDRLQAEIEAKDAELIRTQDDISALEAAIEIMQEQAQ